ncbi:MINY1 hydrolase, partial [Chroicocephalus maculipennis]|nr:MINY1 hydrolase [Chroicocephalus maculipennis]
EDAPEKQPTEGGGALPGAPVPCPGAGAVGEPAEPPQARTPSREAEADFYCVKWITWKGERTPVIMQSENGPCPLLAIMNILFLQWKASGVKLPPQKEVVTAEELMAHLGDCILSTQPREPSEGLQLNFQQVGSEAVGHPAEKLIPAPRSWGALVALGTRLRGHLYLLVTDQGFLQEERVVWESLHNVDGDSCFCDTDFHLSHAPGKEGATAAPPDHHLQQRQVDQDYMIALSLQQQQGQDPSALSDLELARQLQQEEYQQQQQQQPPSLPRQGRAQPGGRPAGERRQRQKPDLDCTLL